MRHFPEAVEAAAPTSGTGNMGTHLCGFCAADTGQDEEHSDACYEQLRHKANDQEMR